MEEGKSGISVVSVGGEEGRGVLKGGSEERRLCVLFKQEYSGS